MREIEGKTVQPDIVKTYSKSVTCDGNGGVYGHPRVYLDVEKQGYVVCPYCSKRFELEKSSSEKKG